MKIGFRTTDCLAVHCETKNDVIKTCFWANKIGLTWASGKLFVDKERIFQLCKIIPVAIKPYQGTYGKSFLSSNIRKPNYFIRKCKEKLTHDKKHT